MNIRVLATYTHLVGVLSRPTRLASKVTRRLLGSFVTVLLIALAPAAAALLAANALLFLIGLPQETRQVALIAFAGAIFIIVIVAAVDRSGVHFRWERGELVVRLKRRT